MIPLTTRNRIRRFISCKSHVGAEEKWEITGIELTADLLQYAKLHRELERAWQGLLMHVRRFLINAIGSARNAGAHTGTARRMGISRVPCTVTDE